jgi:serine/threonine protein kinase
LKPGNVLCHHDEWTVTVKVADFGIVKEMEGEFATTGVGTVAYMSPERLHVDDRVGYGFAADVWAAGLIAGECACGVHLYPAEVQSVQWEYMAYVQDEPTPNLDRERYSPEICDLIDMCLQKEQRHRPSAQHLLQHPFVTNTQSTRLMVVNDPRLGCDILRVRLTEEVVGSFLEHYYATLREDPRRLFELYCDDSVCELAGVGTHRGAEEICGCLDEVYGGSLMIEPDPQRVNLVEMEGGRGYEARVEGTLLLKQDGEDGRPKEFADVLRVVSEGMTLLVEFESHECWE